MNLTRLALPLVAASLLAACATLFCAAAATVSIIPRITTETTRNIRASCKARQ